MNIKDEYPFYSDMDAHKTAHIYTDVRTMERLLNELTVLRELVTRLQKRGTELVEENRSLKKAIKEPLPFPAQFLKKVRVQWFIGPDRTGRGYIKTIYPDGTCDVQDDVGPLHKGRSVRLCEKDN